MARSECSNAQKELATAKSERTKAQEELALAKRDIDKQVCCHMPLYCTTHLYSSLLTLSLHTDSSPSREALGQGLRHCPPDSRFTGFS